MRELYDVIRVVTCDGVLQVGDVVGVDGTLHEQWHVHLEMDVKRHCHPINIPFAQNKSNFCVQKTRCSGKGRDQIRGMGLDLK